MSGHPESSEQVESNFARRGISLGVVALGAVVAVESLISHSWVGVGAGLLVMAAGGKINHSHPES